ncbi:MAG: FG-GAP-like repeat-containing protein, partial [Anaerolineae bacterium]
MMKPIKLLLTLVLLSVAVRAPLAHAEGGLVFRPYWTFRTEAPVTHVQAGDINGDGVQDVVVVTADRWVHALENDGELLWRYRSDSAGCGLLVADLDGDEQAAEIIIVGKEAHTMLSGTERRGWVYRSVSAAPPQHCPWLVADMPTDLNGDGRPEGIGSTDSGALFAFNTDTGSTREFNQIGTVAQPVVDVWVGELDGDRQPEIVPSVTNGSDVYIVEHDFNVARSWEIDGEVGLVQAGDVDGDGQAEVVVLSAAWDLFLFESDGSQVWHNESLSVGNSPDDPVRGQLIVYDLDGDGQMEILVMAPSPSAVVHAIKGDGSHIWRHPVGSLPPAATLTAGDTNGDGKAELVVAAVGYPQVYLLDADGHRLAEYRPSSGPGEATGVTTRALDYADLNGDGRGELIVGTETGVQVFGTSDQLVRRNLWEETPRLAFAAALYFTDLDGDGQDEVLAGLGDGRVQALADGRILWEVNLGTPVLALSAGDADGDRRPEVAVGTFGDAGTQVHLLDDNVAIWTVPVEGTVSGIAVRDLTGDEQAEIIIASGSDSTGLVVLMDSEGNPIWQRGFTESVTAVGSDGGHVLVGTQSGQVLRLTADGTPAGEYDLEAKVLSLDAGLAATVDGKIYQLHDGGAIVLHDLEEVATEAQVSTDRVAVLTGERELSLVDGSRLAWTASVDDKVLKIAAGDVNGDGEAEIAAATRQRIQLFGLALDQPPLLTEPSLADTRTGYTYRVKVKDPEGDTVNVALEIWDPSAGAWLSQAPQSVRGQGRLRFEVPNPFNTWDSGRESRFRFVYDDGYVRGTTAEVPGPFAIPTAPWYVHYGQRFGLAALILAVPALGLLLYRRQRAYRLSPVGRAETLLRELRANPDAALLRLHTLAHDDPALLTYLPGLAGEAGQSAIADLSEGFHLILTRPEVGVEGLRAVVGATERLDGSRGEHPSAVAGLYNLFLRMLETNTVSRIVALRPQLDDVGKTIADPEGGLTAIAEALADLGRVARTLHNYQRVDLVEDKVAYLAQAMESLSRLDRQFRAALPQPAQNILTHIAAHWMTVTTSALQDLQGRARIEAALRTRQVLHLDDVTLALELTNTGRSPASNVTVTLVPGRDYKISGGSGTAHLDILPAGRSAVVELAVSAAPSADHFRAEFTITFDDRERTCKTHTFADLVQLMRPAAEFQPVPNPYAPGTPLRPDSPIFFGREDLFQFIRENMSGLARQNILVLIGQRRMGKTSFLQQLPARLGEDYLPVYLDGQSLGIDPGMANFFYDLSLAIVDGLADQGIDLEEPGPEDFEERPSGYFERTFLPTVFDAIGRRQLLLLFDEFEELEMRVASGKLEPTIFSYFRHLMQHGGSLGFIFVGTHRMEQLGADYWSILFNIALYKHVTFLDDGAARALIVEPVAEHGLLYDDLALDKMLRVTAGHPYFLQLICHALMNHANRERRGYLTIQDVNDVLGEMVELGEAHFAFLWEQSDVPERLVLASLTRLLGQAPMVPAPQISELLAERGVALELREVTGALRRLAGRDIVREVAGQPSRYDFKVELVRLWVEQYKPLGRVVEEVG